MFKGKIGVNCFELFRVEKHHDNIRLLIKGTVKTNVDGSGSKIIVKQTISDAGKLFSLLWVISLLFSIFLIIAGALVGDQHEAVISEEEWNLAQIKRKKNAYKREKVNDPDHEHILSGILKCPCCGKSLYGNIAKAHSKDKKTRYYYYCKNTVNATGHKCKFCVKIEQKEMKRMVATIISAMVNKPVFVNVIKEKIGTAIDTEDMEKELETLRGQLRQIIGIKNSNLTTTSSAVGYQLNPDGTIVAIEGMGFSLAEAGVLVEEFGTAGALVVASFMSMTGIGNDSERLMNAISGKKS